MNFFVKNLHVFIAIILAALVCTLVMIWENSVWEGQLAFIRLLCDGTFFASVLFLGSGGMVFISQHGGFDALRYALIKLKDRFLHPRYEDRSDEQTYFDYVQSKRKEKKAPFLYLLIIGGVLFACAFVLMFFAPDAPLY